MPLPPPAQRRLHDRHRFRHAPSPRSLAICAMSCLRPLQAVSRPSLLLFCRPWRLSSFVVSTSATPPPPPHTHTPTHTHTHTYIYIYKYKSDVPSYERVCRMIRAKSTEKSATAQTKSTQRVSIGGYNIKWHIKIVFGRYLLQYYFFSV